MDSSTVENYTPTFLDQVAWQFHDLPAAWIAILTIALTYAALWLTRKALPRYRIIQALKTAPAVTLGSGGGVLRRSAKDRGGKTPVSLRRSADGVLLLSARTEPETLRRFQLGFGFLAAAITVCTALATWMFIEHVSSYPNQSIPEYVDALMTRPWVLGPGQNPGN